MTFATTDLCDDHPELLEDGRLAVLPPLFTHFGQHPRFCGKITTLKVFEDNALVRATLEAPGNGNVLVIDGGASLRRALVGGQLALLAQNNGWSGIVVDGCVRDSDEINACAIGVRALATHPRKSSKLGAGERNVRICVSGVAVQPGGLVVCRCRWHRGGAAEAGLRRAGSDSATTLRAAAGPARAERTGTRA
ncbi:Ribonuclease E inhibitor RraA [Janthinobacterium sp. CG23_2]|nr:Ribonuclease E inhibitor RraA [Janthinobacterium sp. CG23_2]CUU32300.1 Ribonuclease E inhibitor RraA [Janthinobacterium sp. CG23_2]